MAYKGAKVLRFSGALIFLRGFNNIEKLEVFRPLAFSPGSEENFADTTAT